MKIISTVNVGGENMDNAQILKMLQNSEDVNNDLIMQLYDLNRGIMGKAINNFVGIIEKDDAEQESYFALLDAVKNYKPKKGSFANYYYMHIVNRLKLYAAKINTAFYIPYNLFWKVKKYEKTRADFFNQWEIYPNIYTLADLLETTPEEVKQLEKISIQLNIQSIDTIIPGTNEEITLLDTLAADSITEIDIIEKNSREEVAIVLWDTMQKTAKIPADILKAYYNLQAKNISNDDFKRISDGQDPKVIKQKIKVAIKQLKKRDNEERKKLKRILEENDYIYSLGLRPSNRHLFIYSTEYAAIKLYEHHLQEERKEKETK